MDPYEAHRPQDKNPGVVLAVGTLGQGTLLMCTLPPHPPPPSFVKQPGQQHRPRF